MNASRASDVIADRADDDPSSAIAAIREGETLQSNAIHELDMLHADASRDVALQNAIDEAKESRPTLPAPPEPAETAIAAQTELGYAELTVEGEPRARLRASPARNQQPEVSSVSALVLKPRAAKMERRAAVAPRSPERPSPSRGTRRHIGWTVGAVALLAAGWWLVPAMHGSPQAIPAVQDTVMSTKAAPPPSNPAETVRPLVRPVAASAHHIEPPIEHPSEASAAEERDGAPHATTLGSRLAAYRIVTLAAAQAASCRHRGDGPGPVRVSVSFGSNGQVDGVRIDRAYAGTLTGRCIAAKLRALPPSASVSERTTTAVDVQLH